jgi:hypothetical protein
MLTDSVAQNCIDLAPEKLHKIEYDSRATGKRMNRYNKHWIRCAFFGWLFFFAATADFISTSVISGGHDANNPLVHIEHKCVGKASKIHQKRFGLPVVHSAIQLSLRPEPAINPWPEVLSFSFWRVPASSSEFFNLPMRC